ncbi:hypothetical protein [uncultured Microbulbifer sp.]|uniref:hypothetical protein n=1 Tax=uncultured Microbulbifer sp. TaxID=348147 RepID=UPI0025D14B2F|nr:hypothetical protein [uncultured Microbulbifer sp.]
MANVSEEELLAQIENEYDAEQAINEKAFGYWESKLWEIFDPEKHWFASDAVRAEFFPQDLIERSRKYPHWVPTVVLITLLNTQEDAKQSPETCNLAKRLAVLEQLCTHPEMKKIWRRLFKRRKSGDPRLDPAVNSMDLEIYHALHFRSPWEGITPAARKAEYEQILNLTKQLAGKLETYGINRRTLSLFPDKALNSILGPKFELHPARISQSPTIAALLDRLHADLVSNPPHEEIALKTATKNDSLTIFIRHLSIFFNDQYGSNLIDNLASLAKVFFGEDLTESRVRAIVKATPEGAKYRLK